MTAIAAAIPLHPTYGKKDLPDSAGLLTQSRMRHWKEAREKFIHRTKNGLNDPFTYFHVVRWLLQVKPWNAFYAKSLAHALNEYETAFFWDPITVGRILNDIAESIELANPGPEFQAMRKTRWWNGTRYEVTDYAPAREVLMRLLDDLVYLGEAQLVSEAMGIELSRKDSILSKCPSLQLPPLAA